MESEIELAFHNESTSEEEHWTIKSGVRVYIALCFSLIFFISSASNSFLLWVLLKERAWKTTPDILLLQLTVSNLCYTVTLPFHSFIYFHYWIFGEWACGLLRGMTLLGRYSYMMILTAMIFHQYVAPFRVSCLSAKTCGLVVSIVIWVVCAVASIAQSVTSTVEHYSDLIICEYSSGTVSEFIIGLFTEMTLSFFIPFIIITFCYIHTRMSGNYNRTNNHRQPSKLIPRIAAGTFLFLAPDVIVSFVTCLVVFDVFFNHLWIDYFFSATYIIIPPTSFYCCLSPLVHILGAQRFRHHLALPCGISSRSTHGSADASTVRFIPLQDAQEM
ncbi:C-C chemokine receptor type 8-like [Pholidichthys leucotaenia]